MKLVRLLAKLAVCLSAGSLSACLIQGASYPRDWPELSDDGKRECPDLTGSYSTARASILHSSAGSLPAQVAVDRAFYDFYTETTSTTRIEVVQPDCRRLIVHFFADDYETSVRNFEKLSFSKDALEVRQKEIPNSSNSLVIGSGLIKRVRLRVAIDGSLVIDEVTRSYGLFLGIIPFYHSDQTYWLRVPKS